jgi:hypothetical protein
MGFGGSPSAPAIPPVPPAAQSPTMASPIVAANAAAGRQRAMAGAALGASANNPTGAQGLTTPPQTTTSVLGD